MDDSQEHGLALPQVQRALEPFIKSREETLKVRRIITTFLQNQIDIDNAVHGGTYFLSSADRNVGVRKIPSEFTGLRKQYLKVLQANLRVRKEHEALLAQDPVCLPDMARFKSRDDLSEQLGDSGTVLPGYLELLHERKRYERLRILQDYTEILTRKFPANSKHLDHDQMFSDLSPLPQLPPGAIQAMVGVQTEEANADEILERLERAVLKAKQNLENERRLLSELKSKRAGIRSYDNARCSSKSEKSGALGRTRNELIAWIEGELAKSSHNLDDGLDIGFKPSSDTGRPETSVENIRQSYAEYVRIRREIFQVSPSVGLDLGNDTEKTGRLALRQASVKEVGELARPGPTASAFLNLGEQLFLLLSSQKLLLQQKSHISTSLAKQQRTSLQSLDKSAHESHLLPAYPLLVRRPGFNNATTFAARAMGTPTLTAESKTTGGDEAMDKARAWAFASSAATESHDGYVRERVREGSERINRAEALVLELKGLIGESRSGGETEHAQANNKYDDWAIESAQTRNHKGSKSKPHKGDGLWSRLNGKIGLIGDL